MKYEPEQYRNLLVRIMDTRGLPKLEDLDEIVEIVKSDFLGHKSPVTYEVKTQNNFTTTNTLNNGNDSTL